MPAGALAALFVCSLKSLLFTGGCPYALQKSKGFNPTWNTAHLIELSQRSQAWSVQVTVLWWVSAEHSERAGAPTGGEASGRFFGGRWFPREGRVSDEELQALRYATVEPIRPAASGHPLHRSMSCCRCSWFAR